MAADFLESNLFSPTAPSEQALKEAKLRRQLMREEGKRRIDRNEVNIKTNSRRILQHSSSNDNIKDQNDDHLKERFQASITDEAIPLEVLLHSKNLRQLQKDLMRIDMNVDTYCRNGVREILPTRTENLTSLYAPLTVIEEDKEEIQEDTKLEHFINVGTNKNNRFAMSSPGALKGNFSCIGSHERNLSYAQKNVLYRLHSLLNAKSRKVSKRDDKILLVEKSNSEPEIRQQNDLQNNNKGKNELTYFLVKRIQNLWHKLLQEKNKDANLVEVPAPKKKKRRLRKKNVHRIGSHIQKRFCYGCRYIGHGIANMTSVIPEASYAGNLCGDFRYNDFQFNEYYDPNTPAWNFHKGIYIRKS